MSDLNILLKAVVSISVKNYDNQIDYICELLKRYKKLKNNEL